MWAATQIERIHIRTAGIIVIILYESLLHATFKYDCPSKRKDYLIGRQQWRRHRCKRNARHKFPREIYSFQFRSTAASTKCPTRQLSHHLIIIIAAADDDDFESDADFPQMTMLTAEDRAATNKLKWTGYIICERKQHPNSSLNATLICVSFAIRNFSWKLNIFVARNECEYLICGRLDFLDRASTLLHVCPKGKTWFICKFADARISPESAHQYWASTKHLLISINAVGHSLWRNLYATMAETRNSKRRLIIIIIISGGSSSNRSQDY